MSDPSDLCAATGCTQLVHGAPWSNLCRKHAARQYRTGSLLLDTVRRGELAKYRERISFLFDKYACSKPVTAAVMVADDLLNWRPRMGFTNHYRLAANMERLRNGGCT